mmetsp:Transcript_6010/g.8344  ORF Transcript_6010/g.8344 Transcript_6010/m.8344 type:complete len:102 (+) Transcript_6010:1264-1569(+)
MLVRADGESARHPSWPRLPWRGRPSSELPVSLLTRGGGLTAPAPSPGSPWPVFAMGDAILPAFAKSRSLTRPPHFKNNEDQDCIVVLAICCKLPPSCVCSP